MKRCKYCNNEITSNWCNNCKKTNNNVNIFTFVGGFLLILIGILIIGLIGGAIALFIYFIFQKLFSEKRRILLANISFLFGLIFSYWLITISTNKNGLSDGQSLFNFITNNTLSKHLSYRDNPDGLIIIGLAFLGFYSLRIMYRKALFNNNGLIENVFVILFDKQYFKYTKYYNTLHNDPEYVEALKGVKTYAKKMDDSAKEWEKAKIKSDKSYNEYAKRYGKEAADKIVADVKAGTYKFSWKKKY